MNNKLNDLKDLKIFINIVFVFAFLLFIISNFTSLHSIDYKIIYTKDDMGNDVGVVEKIDIKTYNATTKIPLEIDIFPPEENVTYNWKLMVIYIVSLLVFIISLVNFKYEEKKILLISSLLLVVLGVLMLIVIVDNRKFYIELFGEWVDINLAGSYAKVESGVVPLLSSVLMIGIGMLGTVKYYISHKTSKLLLKKKRGIV